MTLEERRKILDLGVQVNLERLTRALYEVRCNQLSVARITISEVRDALDDLLKSGV